MYKLIFSVVFFLLFCGGKSQAQEKWALIQDLNEDWLYFDEEWLPVTDRFDVYDAIYLKLKPVSANHHLMVKYPGGFSIFINKKIFYTATDSLMINIDSLLSLTAVNNPVVAVYDASGVEPSRLRTQLYLKYNPQNEPEVTNVINVIRRKFDRHKDAYIAAFLFLLLYLVLLKIFYPRNLEDFYNVRKTISSRDTDEDFLRGRLFSQVNLLIMVFQCLVVGLFITILLINFETRFNSSNFYFADYLMLWLRCSFFVANFILLKFILIRNFTSLYNMYNFSTPHFMSYLRMITLTFGVALILLYIMLFAFGWQDIPTYTTHLNAVLVALGIGILIIYFKLLNSVPYKNLHLFSYLCATEILPYVVIIKVAINQSI